MYASRSTMSSKRPVDVGWLAWVGCVVVVLVFPLTLTGMDQIPIQWGRPVETQLPGAPPPMAYPAVTSQRMAPSTLAPSTLAPPNVGPTADFVNLDRLLPAEPRPAAPPYAGLGATPPVPPTAGSVALARRAEPAYGNPPAVGYEMATPDWGFQFLPESILYKAYLAGMKESRLAGHVFSGDSGVNGGDLLFEGTLGGRFGLFRIGNRDNLMPQGFQLDVEGSAQVRLNTSDDVDVQATDYRIGLPLTFANGPWQLKTGYYHLSSHAGDEFLLKRPGFPRLNYARDVLLLGVGYQVTRDLRVYGEVGWAFYSDVANEWEFQFGVDYAPALPTGVRGAPFVAFNTHLREELNYGGNVAFQLGWAWRTDVGRLLRIGLHAYSGESNQYSFFDYYEEQIGVAVWYDY